MKMQTQLTPFSITLYARLKKNVKNCILKEKIARLTSCYTIKEVILVGYQWFYKAELNGPRSPAIILCIFFFTLCHPSNQ